MYLMQSKILKENAKLIETVDRESNFIAARLLATLFRY
jgi:hypothetical protein